MNRNVESHFSRIPQMNHPRSSFDRSSGHSTSFNAGEIIPIFCDEVLPGDTVSMNTSSLVRLQTLLTPLFGNIYLDTYWFFVPNRLTWSHWKEFMGENTKSHWAPTQTYSIPVVTTPFYRSASSSSKSEASRDANDSKVDSSICDSGEVGLSPKDGDTKSDSVYSWPKGTLADYFGLPVNQPLYTAAGMNALPGRAYALIWNDFFRDQNLQDPIDVYTGDNSTALKLSSNAQPKYFTNNASAPQYCKVLTASKFHDYFTSCLPAPQKGPAVGVPISGQVPVITGKNHNLAGLNPNSGSGADQLKITPLSFGAWSMNSSGTWSIGSYHRSKYAQNATLSTTEGYLASEPYTPVNGYPPATRDGDNYAPINLWASFDASSQYNLGGMSFTINELRLATVIQMYYEALARGGSRYEEQIQQFFGVTNPDSRVQHPEYLGGRRMQINVREITNTAQGEADFLGDVGAQSVTAGSNSDFTKSFTEHGYLIGLAVVRYEHTYHQGVNKMWLRKDKFDFYNPIFARIGEQPVYDAEIYATNETIKTKSVFGYQEAWASYRYMPNRVSSGFRPVANAEFGDWTLSDNYAAKPTLSNQWIQEDKTMLDRVLSVKSSVANQIFADFYFNTTWTRPMPMYSVPGAIGQF